MIIDMNVTIIKQINKSLVNREEENNQLGNGTSSLSPGNPKMEYPEKGIIIRKTRCKISIVKIEGMKVENNKLMVQ